ncbi:universal stress protein [Haladaptatus halobius]|uniref:universal stress protein n=1 Tax=Haladaptatus halobius TaxID=2884875 RepID=UPI001D0B27F3|nr:universal stress protein [Haladaptatus halobius]
MIEHILIPTDGSDEAGIAVDHARELAMRFNATAHVLHVVNVRKMETAPQSNEMRTKGENLVGSTAEEITQRGVAVETEVQTGHPSDCILEYVAKQDIDTIVMGTHGRTGVRQYLLGSVTEKVIRLSEIPVLTVRLSADRPLNTPYNNILVPTDGSQGALEATKWGMAIAGAFDGTIHAFSVVESAVLGIDLRTDFQEQIRESAEHAVADVVDAAHDEDLDTTAAVSQGIPYREILSYITEYDIDLVVMGTQGRSKIDRYLLGSVAEKTIRTASIPVMTVRRPATQ